MALKRTKLLNIQSITGINTVGILTVGVTSTAGGVGIASTSYLRGVIMHNTGLATCTSSLYIYPTGVAATGVGIGFDEIGFDEIGFDRGTFALPPGLSIDPETGWLHGYIPDQGATETTYRFAVQVLKANNPAVISPNYFFTITIIGNIDTEVTWLTDPNLGTIDNGAISMFNVTAVNTGNRSLAYRLLPGSDSSLPQGLTLQSNGNIVGRVSFNTFALDGGTTTFDADKQTRIGLDPTTFDLTFSFDVNAYAPVTEQRGYSVTSIVVTNGGSGYIGQPTITISAPPPVADAIQATAGIATEVSGITSAVASANTGISNRSGMVYLDIPPPLPRA
jgi:hypothetical protein